MWEKRFNAPTPSVCTSILASQENHYFHINHPSGVPELSVNVGEIL